MKRYLITGASRGIGRAIAERQAADGIHLLLHGRDRTALQETADAVTAKGAEATIVTADLSSTADVEAMIRSLGDQPLDLLVNNAGMAVVKPVGELSLEEWDANIAVNITAPFLLIRGLLKHMSEGAAIANILSVAANTGFPNWTSYCMAKAAIQGFASSLREELRPRGIRVINLYPSATDSDLWDSVPGDWPRDKMLAPEETAEALAYALSRPADVLVESIHVGDIGGTL